jgi:hypothetical protein
MTLARRSPRRSVTSTLAGASLSVSGCLLPFMDSRSRPTFSYVLTGRRRFSRWTWSTCSGSKALPVSALSGRFFVAADAEREQADRGNYGHGG